MSEKAEMMFERIRFEAWAKKNEFCLDKAGASDFSGMPAYMDPETYAAWAGWIAKTEQT